jgi:hypothetical protein
MSPPPRLLRLALVLGLLGAPLITAAPRKVGACGSCECLETAPFTFPADGAIDVPTSVRIFVNWPDPGVTPAFQLTEADTGTRVEVTIDPSGGDPNQYFVTPGKPLVAATRYQLTSGDDTLSFTTGSGPASAAPQLGEVTVREGAADLCVASRAASLELAVVSPDRRPVLLQIDLPGSGARLFLLHHPGKLRLGALTEPSAECGEASQLDGLVAGQEIFGTITALGQGGQASDPLQVPFRFADRRGASCPAAGC